MFEVRMPQKGLTETSAYLSKWYVKVGDAVKANDYLFAMETSKSVFDVEAEVEGTVIAILYEEGDEVEIEKVVCVLGEAGETYDAAVQSAPAPAQEPAQEPAPAAAEPAPAKEEPVRAALAPVAAEVLPEGARVAISPRARAKAAELGIEYRDIVPTGPEGRIIEKDIIKAYEAESAKEVPAESMAAAAAAFGGQMPAWPFQPVAAPLAPGEQPLPFAAPETQIFMFDAGDILSYEKKLADAPAAQRSLNTAEDMILYAVSRVTARHPQLAKGMPVFFAQKGGACYFVPALDVNAGWSLGVGAPKKERSDSGEMKTIALALVYDTRAIDRGDVNAFAEELISSLENFEAFLVLRA